MNGGLLAAAGQRAVDLLGLPERMLQPEALMRRFEGQACLAPFEGENPLRMLLDDYCRHANLSLVGCFAARFDVTRLLRNLAALREHEAREPELLAWPIDRPIFITGLPRSGSTFLFKLLAEDPENRAPASWETVFPLPRSAGDVPARRIAAMNRLLATFERMAPNFHAMHPIDATSPQECTEITAHVFRSFRFELTHHMPGYRAWLRRADHGPAYRFHRVFLQHLQYQDGRPRRWVLKCPDHVFTLDALAAAYPDARLVFLHREPLEILASLAGLTAILRQPFTSRRDPAAIGREVVGDWLEGTEAMMRADAQRLFPEERVVHVRFRDLIAAPLATVTALYERFGLLLGAESRSRMERRVAELPSGGYGGLTHTLESYGVDTDSMRRGFDAYADHFDIRA
jgi:hypothetical protein